VDYTVLIPARLASTRLPNKPLASLGDVPMVVRVAQRAQQSSAKRTVVACDSQQIIDACTAHGVEAVLTRQDHPSGSDRLAEACTLLGLPDDAVVVNVQGDEPLIVPALIDEVAALLTTRSDVSMSTAAHAIDNLAEYTNPNVVKVVLDAQQHALYFSRAPIAFWRDGAKHAAQAGGLPSFDAMPALHPLRHIGVYGYRAGFLRKFPTLPVAPIETCEALEQLRAMWHGYRIAVHVTQHIPGPGVDTPEDLARVQKLY
jgi:3-deoxy-manno-octulosonate cytidylyltransferase (CMP-KDO synthetase)